jgi:hypothetical protein
MTFDPEVWGTFADWVIVATAIAAVVFAKGQLETAGVARRDAIELERANLLLRIDEKFEGTELLDSRKAWVALRDRVESEVRTEHMHADDSLQATEAARKLSAALTQMWEAIGKAGNDSERESATEAYLRLIRLLHWIETVGHLVERNLIPRDDVLDLYDHVVIRTVGYAKAHITYRREIGPVTSKRILEKALWLLDEALRYKAMREEPPVGTPSRTNLPWSSK